MNNLREIFGLSEKNVKKYVAVWFEPGSERHLKIAVDNLPLERRELESKLKKNLDSPAISIDIKHIWELNDEAIVYYVHRKGNVIVVDESDLEKMLKVRAA